MLPVSIIGVPLNDFTLMDTKSLCLSKTLGYMLCICSTMMALSSTTSSCVPGLCLGMVGCVCFSLHPYCGFCCHSIFVYFAYQYINFHTSNILSYFSIMLFSCLSFLLYLFHIEFVLTDWS